MRRAGDCDDGSGGRDTAQEDRSAVAECETLDGASEDEKSGFYPCVRRQAARALGVTSCGPATAARVVHGGPSGWPRMYECSTK